MIHCKCVYVLDVYFVCTHFQQAVKILFVCVYNIIAKHLYVCQCTSTCTKSLMVRACVHSQQHTPLSLLLQFVLMLCGCPHPEAIKHPTHASEDSLAYTPCCLHNSSCIRLPCHSALSQELLSTHPRQCVSHVFTLYHMPHFITARTMQINQTCKQLQRTISPFTHTIWRGL